MSDPRDEILTKAGDALDRLIVEVGELAVSVQSEFARRDDLLREIANSGVEQEDPRIPWVTVQIDRETWTKLAAWRVK